MTTKEKVAALLVGACFAGTMTYVFGKYFFPEASVMGGSFFAFLWVPGVIKLLDETVSKRRAKG